MNPGLSRSIGGVVGFVLAAIGSTLVSQMLFDHFFAPPNPRNPGLERVAFILIYGPVILGASITSGIAGAMSTWPSALRASLIGMKITSVPIGAILFIFGTLGGIDRFGGDHLGFLLYLLKGFAQTAAPLLISPLASIIGYNCSALAKYSTSPPQEVSHDDDSRTGNPTTGV